MPENMLERIAVQYPEGFDNHIIKYTNAKGDRVSAVPVETEDTYYLVKVSVKLREMVEDLDIEEIDPEDLGEEFSMDPDDDDNDF
ncbi:MAG: hypothetical protein U5L09_02305 [Bacteroidales bacterium]|nr:hypothetical protein [Bacteroidales bacterium]